MNARRPKPWPRLFWTFQTTVALFFVWVALDGVANLWIGALFAALGGALGAWLVPGEFYPWRPLRLLMFSLYFVRESFRGGVDVALRALAPKMPIEPSFLNVDLWLPHGLPRVVMVATVSLLPGTLSVRLEGNTLRVHALTRRATESLPGLQQRVGRLFSVPEATP